MKSSWLIALLGLLLVCEIVCGSPSPSRTANPSGGCFCQCSFHRPTCARDRVQGFKMFSSDCDRRCYNKCYGTRYKKEIQQSLCLQQESKSGSTKSKRHV
ncbi:locustin [Anabrus simplex]|uniref:locustin n=1 Tax=Anabrus simplex TaxID=316456 RepID=UPI0034DD1E53